MWLYQRIRCSFLLKADHYACYELTTRAPVVADPRSILGFIIAYAKGKAAYVNLARFETAAWLELVSCLLSIVSCYLF